MAQYDVDLREYWRVLKKRKTTVFLTALLFGVMSGGYAIMRTPTPLYSATCSIKYERHSETDGSRGFVLPWMVAGDMETQLSALKSYPVLLGAARIMGVIPGQDEETRSDLPPEQAAIVNGLEGKAEVTREERTNILRLTVTDADPAVAQKLANAMAVSYRELNTREQTKRTTQALQYISAQLEQVRENLRASEEAFNAFTKKNQLVSVDLQGETLLLRAKELRAEKQNAAEREKELNALIVSLRWLERNPTRMNSTFNSPAVNKNFDDTNNALTELLLKRDSLLEDYTAGHPEVVALSRKALEHLRKLIIIARREMDRVKTKGADLTESLLETEGRTTDLMQKKLEFNRLKRSVNTYNEMAALLERRHQEALIKKAEKPDAVTIVRPALLPRVPINPPRTAATGALGILLGIMLGTILAFILESFDTSLGAIEDVEETLGVQVLAVVPQGTEKEMNEGRKGRATKVRPRRRGSTRGNYLVSHFSPQTTVAEGFRALRTNIQFQDYEKKLRTLVVTSASPQEGKSMVAINLAVTLAQTNAKTLLVECDLRKPIIAPAFGIMNTPGLTDAVLGTHVNGDVIKGITDIIIGDMELEDVMVTPGLDHLHLVTSSTLPPNPAELLNSTRMQEVLESFKMNYDFVILDTPPILSTADPMILGTKVDGVLLVYRVGTISRRLLKRALVQLSQMNCRIAGVVLNGVSADISPDFHDFKYYKYYYSRQSQT